MSFISKYMFPPVPVNKAVVEPATPAPKFHGVVANPVGRAHGSSITTLAAQQGFNPEGKVQWAAYQRSRYLATAVDLIASAASKKWHLERKDGSDVDPKETAIIESFLNAPNPEDTFESMSHNIFRDLLIHGACILEFHTSPVDAVAMESLTKALSWFPDLQAEITDTVGALPQPGMPVYLSVLPYDQMEIICDDRGKITGYKQWCINGQVERFDVSEILHIRHPKSRSKVYADSPLNAILSSVLLDAKITERQMHVLKNDIIVDTLFVLKEGRTQDEATAFAEEIKAKYTASGAEGNFMVMASDVEAKNISQGGKEGEYLVLSEKLRNIIYHRYGIPTSVAGETSGTSSSYSAGSDTAYRIFIEQAVRPLSKHVQEMLNRKLLSHFGEIGMEYVLVFDLLDDDDMQDVEKTWDQMLRNGTLTVNEVRHARGKQQPVEGGDIPMIYTTMGAVPLAQAAQGAMVPAATDAPTGEALGKARAALRDLRKAMG